MLISNEQACIADTDSTFICSKLPHIEYPENPSDWFFDNYIDNI